MRQFVFQEACLKCQGCCRFREPESVWSPCLLDNEISRLLENNIPPNAVSLTKRIRLLPGTGKDNFICTFLDSRDNKCKIYHLRPFECQLYPFLVNRRSKRIFLSVDPGCPFVKEKLESQEFKDYVLYLTGFLNNPSQLDILKNNPQIIQSYKEAIDLAELNI